MKLYFALFLLCTVSTWTAVINAKSHHLVSRHEDLCVEFEVNVDVAMTWVLANSSCVDGGGRLAMLKTRSIDRLVINYIRQNDLESHVNTGFWIGLNDRDNEGDYVWSDDEAVSYTNWADGEPDDNDKRDTNGQDCVQLWKSDDLKWDDDYCGDGPFGRKKGFICEYIKQDCDNPFYQLHE